jgi:serpin B
MLFPARLFAAFFLLAAALLTACASEIGQAKEARSDIPRQMKPAVASADLQSQADGNTAFALELYRQIRSEPGNLIYSPYSISTALAMTYAGARGETAQQMADTLHFDLPPDQLHPAFNALDLALRPPQPPKDVPEEDRFQLSVANSLWGQQDFTFLPEFLETLALNYGAGMRLVDFQGEAEAARRSINGWVSDETRDKIQDLLPQGSLDPLTRLVLVNAIYFKAKWLAAFDPNFTQEADFKLLDGSVVKTPTMFSTASYPYYAGQGYQAVELPYRGGEYAMLVFVPDQDTFTQFEERLDSALLAKARQGLQPQDVSLGLPKFTYDAKFQLGELLKSLGMPLAFSEQADFSGMDGQRDLFIGEVFHNAFVAVDEAGTEAAAATAVEMRVTSAPMSTVQLIIDRPFIFLIQEKTTGTLLFVGRVSKP